MQIQKTPEVLIIFAGIIVSAVLISYNAFYNPSAQEIKYIPMTSSEIVEVSEDISSSHFRNGKLSINLATEDELSENLDGISATLAQRIVDYRNENGEFKDISDIMNVKGIGQGKFDIIKNKICL